MDEAAAKIQEAQNMFKDLQTKCTQQELTIANMKRENLDRIREQAWKMERELMKVKRVRQECDLMKKLLSSDVDYTMKEIQTMVSQQIEGILRKQEKAF